GARADADWCLPTGTPPPSRRPRPPLPGKSARTPTPRTLGSWGTDTRLVPRSGTGVAPAALRRPRFPPAARREPPGRLVPLAANPDRCLLAHPRRRGTGLDQPKRETRPG